MKIGRREFIKRVSNVLQSINTLIDVETLCVDTSYDFYETIPNIKQLDPVNKDEYNHFIKSIRKKFNNKMTINNAKLAAKNLKEMIINDTFEDFLEALEEGDIEKVVAFKVWFEVNQIDVHIFEQSLN